MTTLAAAAAAVFHAPWTSPRASSVRGGGRGDGEGGWTMTTTRGRRRRGQRRDDLAPWLFRKPRTAAAVTTSASASSSSATTTTAATSTSSNRHHHHRDLTREEVDELTSTLSLDELCARAAAVRASGPNPRVVTFSPKVFVPLTRACRDACGYCTFAADPTTTTADDGDGVRVLFVVVDQRAHHLHVVQHDKHACAVRTARA